MTKLAQTATYVRIPRGLGTSAANLYAKVTVQNSLARFDDKVGWLLVPYIDTLDGSMDETGDEELVTIAWYTGFSVGTNYVLTSRYPLLEADRIVVHQGGNVFEIPSGKVVAISDRSNLALLRIDGINGTAFPMSTKETKPAQDVSISGYSEPGFTGDAIQRRTATIVDLPNVLRHVDNSTFLPKTGSTVSRVSRFNYRDMIMHDAITTAGMEGSPLIDQQGKVVGIHLGNRPAFGAYGSTFSLAEPTHYALSFLKPIIADLRVEESAGSIDGQLDSKQLRELTENSIYQLAIQKRAPRLAWSHRIEELHRLQQQGNWTSYEDKTCMACNGSQAFDCTNRGCARGSIRRKERELKSTDPNTGAEIWGYRVVVEQCPVCNGKGRVKCPNCDSSGNDKTLL